MKKSETRALIQECIQESDISSNMKYQRSPNGGSTTPVKGGASTTNAYWNKRENERLGEASNAVNEFLLHGKKANDDSNEYDYKSVKFLNTISPPDWVVTGGNGSTFVNWYNNYKDVGVGVRIKDGEITADSHLWKKPKKIGKVGDFDTLNDLMKKVKTVLRSAATAAKKYTPNYDY